LKLLKCLFTDVFGTPMGHPESKPFVDRVMGFYYVDRKVRRIDSSCACSHRCLVLSAYCMFCVAYRVRGGLTSMIKKLDYGLLM